MITKLVMHYEYFARNEARYEARNASVWLLASWAAAGLAQRWITVAC